MHGNMGGGACLAKGLGYAWMGEEYKRAVCILLECILIVISFHSVETKTCEKAFLSFYRYLTVSVPTKCHFNTLATKTV